MTESAARVVLDPVRGRVTVRDARLTRFQDALLFAARTLACQAVTRLECDVSVGVATLDVAAAGPVFGTAVAELSAAIRSSTRQVALPRDIDASRRFTVWRVGRQLTTWQVHLEPGERLRFRHPRMRRDRVLARSLERLVVTLPGVRDAALAGWASDLVIRLDTSSCDADALVQILQRAVEERASVATVLSSPWQMAGQSATLGILAATDLLLPALAPVSAVILVGRNLSTLAAAAGDLRRRQIGPAVVASAIILGTLATGQFLAAGIMAWSFEFWRRRHRRDVEAERLLLLQDAVTLPTQLMQADPAAALVRCGERVVFSTWDVLPADGIVVAGGGVIDERCLTGIPGGRVVTTGDRVPAGAVILGGSGELAVEQRTQESRIADVARLLASATEFQPGRFAPRIEADELVTCFAGPTLATAGLGFLAGDLTTAVAVLRPDYGTAEAMSLSFEDLDAVACGLGTGCLLTAPGVLDSLHSIDTLIILSHPGFGEPDLVVSRITTSTADGESEAELVRLAASLARHVADRRREALARVATERGCILSDVVPESFGDASGLRIVFRQGTTSVALSEGAVVVGGCRSLRLEVDGTVRATFEFGSGSRSRAACGIERILASRPLKIVIAGSVDIPSDMSFDERISGDAEAVQDRLAALRHAGRKVAIVGLPDAVSELVSAADVTIALGLPSTPLATAAVICLPADLGSLGDLLSATADRRRRLSTARRLSIIPNAACVAGAFLFGFTSVVAAVVSNLGTLGIYRRASGSLQRRRRVHWLRQRALLPRLAGRAPLRSLPRAAS